MEVCNGTIKEEDEDDEEWYPPSPPIYDVTDKLIEINREHDEDPTSAEHLPNKLRWKDKDEGDNLVQIKWLYSNDCDHSGFISDGTEEEVSSSDEGDGMSGLAASLASQLGARLCLSQPPPVLPNIKEGSGDVHIGMDMAVSPSADYDEDFEEPSLHCNLDDAVLKDNDIMTQIGMSNNLAASEVEEVSISSSSSESCRTVTTIRISRKDFKEANNNSESNSLRPIRPKSGHPGRTSLMVTSDSSASASNSGGSKSGGGRSRHRSSSLPKSNVSNNSSSPYIVSSNTTTSSNGGTSSRKMQKANHATIQTGAGNNNNSCSSSEEGSNAFSGCSSSSPSRGTGNHHRSSLLPPSNSSSRNKATGGGSLSESRAKTKTSVYLNGNTLPVQNGAIVGQTSKARRCSIPPLNRKSSRNSLSSNSSVSSQTTEDSLSSNGLLMKRLTSGRPLVHHRHPSVVADVMSPLDESPYFLQWKLRKREEKKLRERRSFLEQQMRRH